MSLNKKATKKQAINSRELSVEELTQVGGAWGVSDTGYYDYYDYYGYGGEEFYDYSYDDYSFDSPGYEVGTDYCTGVPDAPFGYDFSEACYNHDQNYSQDTTMTRSEADDQFLSDMKEICADDYNNDLLCVGTAYVYYGGVRALGGSHYEGNP